MLKKLSSMFVLPDFVASATPEMLDPSDPRAVLAGAGLRIDNRAAAWCAGAELHKRAASGDHSDDNTFAGDRVRDALNIFEINPESFTFMAPKTHHIKLASDGYEVDFHIADAAGFSAACEDFMQKRASLPAGFRKGYAAALLGLPFNDSSIPANVATCLGKIAGGYAVNTERTMKVLNDRADTAVNLNQTPWVDHFRKLATAIQAGQMVYTDADELINCIDLFDRSVDGLHKRAGSNSSVPEELIFNSMDETLADRANGAELIAGCPVPRKNFYNAPMLSKMASWIADTGAIVPEEYTPEDVMGAAKQLPKELGIDFAEAFKA